MRSLCDDNVFKASDLRKMLLHQAVVLLLKFVNEHAGFAKRSSIFMRRDGKLKLAELKNDQTDLTSKGVSKRFNSPLMKELLEILLDLPIDLFIDN